VAAEHHALSEVTQQLNDAEQKLRDRGQREDLLRYQIKEIADVNPQPDELTTLISERDRQRHAERLIAATGGAEEALYSNDDALCTALARISQNLAQAASWDPSLSQWSDAIANVQAQLEDVARDLGSYARHVTLDADQLAQAEERIDALDRLKRKYGGSLEAVIAHRQRAELELSQLEQGEEHLATLRQTLEARRERAMEAARKLSAARKKAAKKLSTAVSAELATLGMGDAEILVEVEPAAERDGELSVDGARLSATGIDRVEFLIAPNRGEAPQPLRKIASGGELSRAMLAIKRVLAEHGPVAMYVFDEVDAGVGGAVAEVIGRKLAEVARHHQVMCITHLPQIAVFAQTHFRVHKEVENGRTHSRITRLKKSDQKEEIARMLGGVKITDKTRAAAAEMLKMAGQV
jgi:DNA repair protein RecN (Recombination protein N)